MPKAVFFIPDWKPLLLHLLIPPAKSSLYIFNIRIYAVMTLILRLKAYSPPKRSTTPVFLSLFIPVWLPLGIKGWNAGCGIISWSTIGKYYIKTDKTNEINYYVPLSSPKPKHRTMKNIKISEK